MGNWESLRGRKNWVGGLFPLPYLTLPACEWWEKLSFSCIRQKSALLILPPDERLGAREERKIRNQTIPKEPEPRAWPLQFHIMISCCVCEDLRPPLDTGHIGCWDLTVTTTAGARTRSRLGPFNSRMKSLFCSTYSFPSAHVPGQQSQAVTVPNRLCPNLLMCLALLVAEYHSGKRNSLSPLVN